MDDKTKKGFELLAKAEALEDIAVKIQYEAKCYRDEAKQLMSNLPPKKDLYYDGC